MALISTTPPSVAPAGTITIIGSGFPPGELVTIDFVNGGVTSGGTLTADFAGDVSGNVTAPASTGPTGVIATSAPSGTQTGAFVDVT